MNKGWLVPGSLALGAGLVYFLDPRSGAQRRDYVTNRVARAGREAARWSEQARQTIGQHTNGLTDHLDVHELASSPEKLAQRVRTRLQQIASHPAAIDVAATPAGRVMLSGVVPSAEAEQLIRHVRNIAGVRSVENWLEAREGDLRRWYVGRRRNRRLTRRVLPLVPLVAAIGGGALLLRAAARRRSAELSPAAGSLPHSGLLAPSLVWGW